MSEMKKRQQQKKVYMLCLLFIITIMCVGKGKAHLHDLNAL